jgi:uncharacterized protein GlcG (DUF336 family)
MAVLQNRPELSSEGALLVLQAATAKAREIGVPQCIAIVDRGGHLLAFLPMDGAKVLSQWSATQKAVTAASSAAPSGELAEPLAAGLVAATQGRFTNLRGGLPIMVQGYLMRPIGGLRLGPIGDRVGRGVEPGAGRGRAGGDASDRRRHPVGLWPGA